MRSHSPAIMILAATAALAIATSGRCAPKPATPAKPKLLAKRVAIIPVWDVITNEVTVRHFKRELGRARARKAQVVVIDLDTPGGLVIAATALGDLMAKYPKIAFVAYVSGAKHHGAWSAGAFLAMNCKHIAMAPGTGIGAAMVITSTGSVTDKAAPKFQAAWAASMRAQAERNGHSPAVANAMILSEAELYSLTTGDGVKLLDGAQFRGLKEPFRGRARLLKAKGKILALTAAEAQRIGLAKTLTEEQLAKEIGLEGKEVESFARSWKYARGRVKRELERQARATEALKKGMADLDLLVQQGQDIFERAKARPTRELLNDAVKNARAIVKLAGQITTHLKRYPQPGMSLEKIDSYRKRMKAQLKYLKQIQSMRRR